MSRGAIYPIQKIPPEELPLSRPSIYRLISRGELATFKIGNRRYVSQGAIDALIERRMAEQEEEAS